MVKELDAQTELANMLEDKVTALKAEVMNLEAQKHTLTLTSEAEDKLEKAKVIRAENEKTAKFHAIESRIRSKEEALASNEVKYLSRTREVEKREKQIVDIDLKLERLRCERRDFLAYKHNIEKELEVAQNTINEAKEKENALQSIQDSLDGREIAVLEKEKYWSDQIGLLDQERKEFKIEKSNLEALNTEDKNVKDNREAVSGSVGESKQGS